MAGMIFRVDTFFKGTDNFDQLVKIVKVLGEEDLQRYMTKYGLTMPKEVQKLINANTISNEKLKSIGFIQNFKLEKGINELFNYLELHEK